ncbi:hypothetical protein ACKFKF_15860 [Phormidesmis sp. 146-12]
MKSWVGSAIASLLLFSLIACRSSQSTSSPPNPIDTRPTNNLIGLLVVRKDNLTNQFRGEIYPIALRLNDRYLEVNEDVTLDIRNGANLDRLIELKNQRLIVNAIKDFTIVANHQKLGDFQVEKPIIGQFACSASITGAGKFRDQTTLSTVFDQIPKEQSGGGRGIIRNQKFDETWRIALALSQPPTLAKSITPTEAELAQYRQAAIDVGKAAIKPFDRGNALPDEASVESLQVMDLDRNGSSEIFAKIRQGKAASNAAAQNNPTGFATVWLTYRDGKPQLLETLRIGVSLQGVPRSPFHDLLGTADLDGDGIEEIVLRRTDYEAISFEIYKYENDRLQRVFNGAGYGC